MYIKWFIICLIITLAIQHPDHARDMESEEKKEELEKKKDISEEKTKQPEKEKDASKVKYSSSDDNIQVLDYRSIDKTVFSSNKLTLLQFYGKFFFN